MPLDGTRCVAFPARGVLRGTPGGSSPVLGAEQTSAQAGASSSSFPHGPWGAGVKADLSALKSNLQQRAGVFLRGRITCGGFSRAADPSHTHPWVRHHSPAGAGRAQGWRRKPQRWVQVVPVNTGNNVGVAQL